MLVYRIRLELLLSRPSIIECAGKTLMVMFICPYFIDRQKSELLNAVVFAYLDGEKDPYSTYTCNQCNTDTRIEV